MMAALADVLKDVEVFTDGDWVESKDQDPDGDVRLVQLADIGVGNYLNKSSRFMTSEKANELKCTYLKPGDLLVARMPDPLGRACVFPGDDKPCVTVVDVCVVRSNTSRVDSRWLMHWFNSLPVSRAMERSATGTTRKRISRKNIGKLEVQLPPIEEQRRIAAVLDAADALRAKRRQALAKLDTLTQAIFIDMFGHPIQNEREWPERSLEDASVGIFDCPHSTPKWTTEGLVCLRTSNLGVGTWDWTDTRYVSVQTFAERSKRAYLEPDDIIMSREGTVGIAALVGEGMQMCMGQRLVQIRPDRTAVVPRFLLDALLFLLDPDRIAHVMAGSTAKHLNVKELRKLRVIVPTIQAQREYEAVIANSVHEYRRMQDSAEHLDSLFASLQQQAFRGEL